MGEVWRPVKQHEEYQVSDYGRIKSVRSRLILRPRIDGPNNQLRVTFSIKGVYSHHFVHRLVAEAFLDDYHGEQVLPVNGDYTDCRVGNLYIRRRIRTVQPLEHYLSGASPDVGARQWGKRVMIVETGETFRSVNDCANYIRGDFSAVYKCLKGLRTSHKGYTFAYYEPGEYSDAGR